MVLVVDRIIKLLKQTLEHQLLGTSISLYKIIFSQSRRRSGVNDIFQSCWYIFGAFSFSFTYEQCVLRLLNLIFHLHTINHFPIISSSISAKSTQLGTLHEERQHWFFYLIKGKNPTFLHPTQKITQFPLILKLLHILLLFTQIKFVLFFHCCQCLCLLVMYIFLFPMWSLFYCSV